MISKVVDICPPLDYDAWFLDRIIRYLSQFMKECLYRSSRKDRLIEVVRQSIEKGIWYPCLQDFDNWSDWEMFGALEVLVTIAIPEDEVTYSSATCSRLHT